LAGKKIYGPGGGISQFKKLVDKEKVFECKTVRKRHVGRDGSNNCRKILQLSFLKPARV